MKEIVEMIKAHWATFAALAGAVGVLAALLGNIEKIHGKIKAFRDGRRERKNAIVAAVKLMDTIKVDVASMKATMGNMSRDVSSLDRQINQIQNKVDKIEKWNADQSADIKELQDNLQNIDGDTGDLLCSQITREHDYYISIGFCPDSDKRRLEDIHNRYRARGRNHVSKSYMDDINALPPHPPANRSGT